MFKISLYLFLLIGVFALNSCRSTKDITYLSDMVHDAIEDNLPSDAPSNLLKKGNNLYVNIQSTNEEVSKIFNPSSSMQSGGMQVYGEPSGQYIYGYTIDKDGSITLPILGQIEVAGMTQSDAQAKVQLIANKYIKEASVKLKLLNFKVTFLGEVKAPGVIYNYNEELNVFEAAGMAGGFTDMARLDRVLVMRKTSKGMQSYRLDLTDKNVLSNVGYYLQPNDVVIADPSKVKTLQLNMPAISLMLSTITFLLVILKL